MQKVSIKTKVVEKAKISLDEVPNEFGPNHKSIDIHQRNLEEKYNNYCCKKCESSNIKPTTLTFNFKEYDVYTKGKLGMKKHFEYICHGISASGRLICKDCKFTLELK